MVRSTQRRRRGRKRWRGKDQTMRRLMRVSRKMLRRILHLGDQRQTS